MKEISLPAGLVCFLRLCEKGLQSPHRREAKVQMSQILYALILYSHDASVVLIYCSL